MKGAVALLVAVCCAACGSSPTPPSGVTTTIGTTTTTIPLSVSLTGNVTPSVGGANIAGATVTIGDGPNAGKTTLSNGAGAYRFDNLTSGNANLSASATGYDSLGKGVFIDGVNTLNFALRPVRFVKSGVGDFVFDMPTYVARVRIQGHYSGYCENIIIDIARRNYVNEILGTCSIALGPDYDGTFVTSGGVVEITKSPLVNWTFTEVR